ncbi:MAG: hypothetical protein HY335_04525 [Deinococcus sp.]|nr:hypothetical protein [Deinococcus sp.]
MRPLLLVLLLTLSGCVPTLQPLRAPELDLTGSPGLFRDGVALVLTLQLAGVPSAGLLVVEFLAPGLDARVLGTEEIRIFPEDQGRQFTFRLPQVTGPGVYRAVVIFNQNVVQQFGITV